MSKHHSIVQLCFHTFILRFDKLSVYYPSIPVGVRERLAEAIYPSKDHGDAFQCSNIILRLSHSQANWNDLEERACEGIVERMRRTNSRFNNQVRIIIVVIPFVNVFQRILPIPCMLSPYYLMTVTCRRMIRK
jgi:hypothetical protein